MYDGLPPGRRGPLRSQVGSWALPVRFSFVLVAAVKMQEGRFYGEVGAVPAVTGR